MNTVTLVTSTADTKPMEAPASLRGRRSARSDLRRTRRPKPLTPTAAAAKRPDIEKELDAAIPRDAVSSRGPGRGDVLLYAALIALTWAAWQVSHMGLFKPTDDTSYWIAVAGGSMMLVLFTYPLRKHVRFMQGLGKVKWWFWFHLFLGIAGPWLILVHSGFQIRSLNAGVALYSMLVVVCSGVIGRFMYVRVHRGLHGERTSLRALRDRAGFVEAKARTRLHFSPKVESRLLAFEQRELRAEPGWVTHLRQVTFLPVQRRFTYMRCVMELRRPLIELSAKYDWSANDLQGRKRRACRLVDQYLNAVVRVAQYTAFERLFSLWHLAHLPFVYLLVISAIVHVIAVHAY